VWKGGALLGLQVLQCVARDANVCRNLLDMDTGGLEIMLVISG